MESYQTILVVDDEKTNVEFIVAKLEQEYKIKTAPNGKVALKILEKFDIDLILLDIQMPVLDGYETAKQIQNDTRLKEIPIIFLTAKSDSESIIKGFELGAKDYISKPFNVKELQVRVSNHLQTYKLINQLNHAYNKLNSAYDNLQKFIDTQDNVVFLTDGKELHFANKKFFEFVGFETLDEFKKHNRCISENFIENDRFFHLGKLQNDKCWLQHMIDLPYSKRVVTILGRDFKPHAFSVSINEFDDKLYIVGLADISQTMLNQITLENKVLHDKLTGAFNREYFEQNYQILIDKYTSNGYYLGIALLDIDHFKIVNDTYGHDVGDEVLMHFVSTVHKFSRNDDIFIRWGGEEFILILKIMTKADFFKVLDHLRKVIEMQDFPVIGKKTCSIGGAIYENNEDIQKTIKRADEAVYEAKESGRNMVVIQ